MLVRTLAGYSRMANFRATDRLTSFLLDLTAMSKAYRGIGSVLPPSSAVGPSGLWLRDVFSSSKLERATYDSVAFRFIATNDRPDHDTIATFRRRFLKEIEALFVKVLLRAREMGVLKMGTVALDGTKIHANAIRHSALSYEHAGIIEARAKQRYAQEMVEHDAKLAAREGKTWPCP